MRIERNYIGFITIIANEIKRFLKIWPQTLLSSAVTVTLYFIIFSHFTNSTLTTQYAISYIEFIAPGLIMLAVILNAYGNVSFSLWSHRFQHSIEEVLVSPLPDYLILLGFTLAGIVRGVMVGALVTGIALCFMRLNIPHPGLMLFVVICTAALFSLAGFANALCARKLDDIMFVPNFILTPLIFLGGVFYSLSQLSEFWQSVSKINPLLYIINTFRYSLLGITDIDIYMGNTIIISAIAMLFIFNIFLLRKGIGVTV